MKACSACCWFSFFGMMLSRNLQPRGACAPSWSVVQVSAAPLALEAFPRADQALCTQKDNAHCVPRSA